MELENSTGRWKLLVGSVVEIRQGDVVRLGRVEAVTPDESVLWIAAEGADTRFLIHKDDDVSVKPAP